MSRIAFHTLGCKVNQYDTQAMLELFRDRGYTIVPFQEEADIYLINTCTVTGTGDKKSLQLARHLQQVHPGADLILCGCLAQRQGAELAGTGARLILGTQHRARVVDFYEQAVRENTCLVRVDGLEKGLTFEPLSVSFQEERTRATLKIQEGCDGRCAYCVIPSVRGPVRSRAMQEILEETQKLVQAGYHEMVLTGIHLSSYGKDLETGERLIDVIEQLAGIRGVHRIRLGSLEPTIATQAFAGRLAAVPAVCPQFHLALQSGSDTVLQRMRRRYNLDMYREGVRNLRSVYPDAAITTDILTGFPGETEEEFEQTRRFIHEIGFSRIHVFPFSPRAGTPAAAMPGQLSRQEKARRARLLIRDGEEEARAYRMRWAGKLACVLLEQEKDGQLTGYTPEYLPVRVRCLTPRKSGDEIMVCLQPGEDEWMLGTEQTAYEKEL